MSCNAMEDFHRTIGLHVLKRGGDAALLTGTISDRFHDIRLEVEMSITAARVEDIRVTFDRAPSASCGEVAPRLQQLVGMEVGPGMSRRLLLALGGADGCGNLRNLLQCLLPLILNLSAAKGIGNDDEMLSAIARKLQGTCAGYTNSVSG